MVNQACIMYAEGRYDEACGKFQSAMQTTRYNDFDIDLTQSSSLVSTNTVTTVPWRVVHITLLDDSC